MSMKVLAELKARFPKLYTVSLAALTVGAVGGIAAYESRGDSCCFPGASCCHAGSPCCAGHGGHRVAAK
jgi:hypothetical protein